jgi:ATP-dependent helicase/DNAse subunit B
MSLTLVLGPANSAKAGEVLGAYAAAAHRGAWLVVPNARDAEHYRRDLAERAVVLGSVVTFTGLSEEIARRSGYAGRRITALQRERLVAQAVRNAELGSLARAAETSGFLATAEELISELERSLVGPERFARAMELWAADRPDRVGYARDVAALYTEYVDQLERRGRVDGELFTWRALDALRQAPGSWGSDAVFFYGFDDLHPLQLDAVETLARVVGVEVMVSLTYESSRAALRARAEVVEELRPLAERLVELPAVDEYYEARSRPILHHLERQLFEPDPAPDRPEPRRAVRLLEAAGERAEAELIAAELRALLDAGVAGDEIAVVYRSMSALPAVARVFAEYGIPAQLEHRLPLRASPLGQAVLALARCALLADGESSADDLLRYLRAPGVLRRPELADALELEVRCQGLRTVAQARARTPLELGEIDALASAGDPASELVRQGRRLLAAPHRATAALLNADEELDARALATVTGALDELDELGLRPPGGELIRWLETLETDVSSVPGGGAVLVSDPLSVRARRFRAIFICGLQEGEFPRSATPEPFLSDELRCELAACSGLRLRQRGDSLERERYLFYSALSRATESVVLSYRSADEEGNLQLPSPFLADVAELLADGWKERRRKRLLGDLVWPEDEAPTARERERTRAAATGASAAPNGAPGRRLSAATLARVRHTELLSAGALETYADCPIKWLVERELQPRRLEPDAEPLVRGSYMHDVLEQVLMQLGRAVTQESLPQALEILDRVLADQPPPILPGRPEQLRRAAAEAIAADLRRYLRHEAATGCDWEPLRLELRFGFGEEEESLPPLQLGVGAERIAVRGAIDRVDVASDGRRAVVRDYKSGGVRTEYQGGRWSSERRLQVALYMLAVRELLGLDPVAGLYQPLGGRDLRARGVFLDGEPIGGELVGTDGRDREELEAGLGDAAARAISLAARLRRGDVTPCPETCSREGCAYPGICRAT